MSRRNEERRESEESARENDRRDYRPDPVEGDDYREWGAAAPVVTDEGVYGTLPDRQQVFREYRQQERPWRDTLVRLTGMVLAVAAGLWLVALSGSEATSDEAARPALASLVETMVGLPGLLETHEDAIRSATGDAEIPGYPLPITIPAEDVAEGPERWREVILDQSSALLYAEGPGVFGEAEGAGTFSTSGGTRLLMENLTESRHGSFAFLVWPLGIVAVVAAIGIVVVGSSFGRFVALGLATAAAGVPAVAVGVLAWMVVTFVGSDGSALAEQGHEIASDLAGLPLRNGLTFIAAGLAVALGARVVDAVFPARSAPLARTEAYEVHED